jgi:hypothetical protein
MIKIKEIEIDINLEWWQAALIIGFIIVAYRNKSKKSLKMFKKGFLKYLSV